MTLNPSLFRLLINATVLIDDTLFSALLFTFIFTKQVSILMQSHQFGPSQSNFFLSVLPGLFFHCFSQHGR